MYTKSMILLLSSTKKSSIFIGKFMPDLFADQVFLLILRADFLKA